MNIMLVYSNVYILAYNVGNSYAIYCDNLRDNVGDALSSRATDTLPIVLVETLKVSRPKIDELFSCILLTSKP